jgi:hypothetical protein
LRVKKKLMARPSTSVVAAEGTGVPKARAHTAPGGTSRCRSARNICGIIRAFTSGGTERDANKSLELPKKDLRSRYENYLLCAALMELQPR